VVSDKRFRVWGALETALQRHCANLEERLQMTETTINLQQQNNELKTLLKGYLSSQSNDLLAVPPSQTIRLGGGNNAPNNNSQMMMSASQYQQQQQHMAMSMNGSTHGLFTNSNIPIFLVTAHLSHNILYFAFLSMESGFGTMTSMRGGAAAAKKSAPIHAAPSTSHRPPQHHQQQQQQHQQPPQQGIQLIDSSQIQQSFEPPQQEQPQLEPQMQELNISSEPVEVSNLEPSMSSSEAVESAAAQPVDSDSA
jgi:hypothetical protein